MELPKASDLREIFAAARENGVTHIRIGGLEVRLSPLPPAVPTASVVEKMGLGFPDQPGEDPIDVMRREAGNVSRRSGADALDIVASGGRLTAQPGLSADPTAPQ